MTTIALCIPTTPWVPARRASMARLRATLGVDQSGAWDALTEGVHPDHYRELTDRAPNDVWSVTMWKWMLETKADFCLTLQDDVLTPPPDVFWRSLRAMLTHLPKGHALGLSGVHPMAREVARRNHRWYRTTSWIIGWAYGWWREDLARFLEWRLSDEGVATQKAIAPNGEDALQNIWVGKVGIDTWHPVPAICDHDVSIDSSYSNDEHGHRRPWVTWHDYPTSQMTRPDWWAPNARNPTHYHTVAQHLCWWCGKNKPASASQSTKAMICASCVYETVGALLNEREQLAQMVGR